MSKVWSAYDKKLGRMVCLKLLDKEKTHKFEEKFKLMGIKDKPTEGELTEKLSAGSGHPNIVRTIEHGVTTAGEPYIVMEWIDGLGLNFLIETKSPQLNGNRVSYVLQLSDALAFLHRNQFLHRDLCPRNVMVNKENQVKLIDYGLTIPYTPVFCQPGNRTGTADYLAPEIIKRQRTDHRVDIFALGVTAFEVFTGQLPWERSLSSEETLRRHLNTPPRLAKELKPDIPQDLNDILAKAIAKEPNERYRDVKSFRDALAGMERQDY
ncbi:serine/threonine protein kinase [Telmatocola sphagniphila]|uniref:Serine/threonine protein kinase n=2 Tax=Telmatocola sphagniphila TaxID=1123043 RepID=A0A8E6F0H4_9BACT|nr:serine/threonine protein kinase [Telmatocola sphagniphila]